LQARISRHHHRHHVPPPENLSEALFRAAELIAVAVFFFIVGTFLIIAGIRLGMVGRGLAIAAAPGGEQRHVPATRREHAPPREQ
jgi:hypothetical protein